MDTTGQLAREVAVAFSRRNQRKLRKLNDRILKMAVLDFTKQLYELAVLSYVLSKIVSKPRLISKKNEKHLKEIEGSLEAVAANIETAPPKEVIRNFRNAEKAIMMLEKSDRRYLRDFMSKGRLKAAAILYAQGLSLGTASDMTGMDKQDILDYAGRTLMFDRVKEEKTVLERMKVARTLVRG